MKNDRYYIFAFGTGEKYAGKYVKVMLNQNENAEHARNKICKRYVPTWGYLYSQEEWEQKKPLETLLEIIV